MKNPAIGPIGQAIRQPSLGESFHKYLLPTLVHLVLGANVVGALKHRFIDGHKQTFRRIVG